jgi:hypothetical protein
MNGILPGNARFVRKLSKNGQKFANTATGTLPDNNLWRRKKFKFCVALHSLSLRRKLTTPHSSEFVRLGFELFSLP